MIAELSGLFVSAPAAREYDFTDDRGRRVAGTSRRVYVLQASGEAPIQIKFADEHAEAFETIRKAPFGATVRMQVDPGRSVRYVGGLEVKAARAA